MKKVFLKDKSQKGHKGKNQADEVHVKNARVIQQFNETSSDGNRFLRLDYGDFILVTQELDSMWLLGETINGEKGIFPRACVQYEVERDTGSAFNQPTVLNRTQGRRFMSFDASEINAPEREYDSISNEELSTLTNDNPSLKTLTPNQGYVMDSMGSHQAIGPSIRPVENTICVALHDFVPENANELWINRNDRLMIIGEVDDWFNVCNQSGQAGLVPKVYVTTQIEPVSQVPDTMTRPKNYDNGQQRTSYLDQTNDKNEQTDRRASVNRLDNNKYVEILKMPVKIDQSTLINQKGSLKTAPQQLSTTCKPEKKPKENRHSLGTDLPAYNQPSNNSFEQVSMKTSSDRISDTAFQRQKTINELIRTEKTFHIQMKALYHCFYNEKNLSTVSVKLLNRFKIDPDRLYFDFQAVRVRQKYFVCKSGWSDKRVDSVGVLVRQGAREKRTCHENRHVFAEWCGPDQNRIRQVL